ELQAWLIARDSTSLMDVFRNSRYEGHPALWYVLLFLLTRMTQSATIMQATHLLIACSLVYVFVAYAPFNRLPKFLFAFGYFPLYEYSVLSRNYSIGVLLLFLACAQWRDRYTHPLWLATILALAANTSVHALIIALTIELAFACDILLRTTALTQPEAKPW